MSDRAKPPPPEAPPTAATQIAVAGGSGSHVLYVLCTDSSVWQRTAYTDGRFKWECILQAADIPQPVRS